MMEINLKKKYRLNTSFLENHFLELLPRERRSTVRTSHELALEAENRFRQAYERYENMRTRCLKAMGVEEDFFGGYRSFLIELLIPIINRVEKKIARRGPEFLEVKDFLRRRVGPVNYDHFLTDEPLGVYEISDDSSMEEFVHNEFSDGSVGSYWQTEEVDVWDIKRKATVEVRKRLRYEVKKNLADYKSDESISTDSEDWFATQLVKWHQYLNKEWREMKDRKAFDKAQARRLRKESWLRDLRRRASRKPPIKTILVRMPGNVNAIKDLADPRLELIRDRYFEMFDETLDETIDETFHNAFDKTCVGMFDDMFDVMFDEISGESSEDYISLTGQHAEKCYPYDVSTPTSEEEFDHSETWTPWEQQMLLLDTGLRSKTAKKHGWFSKLFGLPSPTSSEEEDYVEILEVTLLPKTRPNLRYTRRHKRNLTYKHVAESVDQPTTKRVVNGILRGKRCLNLKDFYLPSSELRIIIKAITHKPFIRQIILNGNEVDMDVAIYIGVVMEHSRTLRILRMASCGINDESFVPLVHALEHSISLKKLDLSRNSLTILGLNILADVLGKNMVLQSLHLGYNRINDKKIPKMQKEPYNNKSLLELNLKNNNPGNLTGFKFIVTTIMNFQSLRSLNLSGNKLWGRKRARQLRRLSKLPQLTFLDISDNDFNGIPVCKILNSFMVLCPNLQYVNLSFNPFGEEDSFYLIKRIPSSSPIKKIVLDNIYVNKIFARYVKLYKERQNLEIVTAGIHNDFGKPQTDYKEVTCKRAHYIGRRFGKKDLGSVLLRRKKIYGELTSMTVNDFVDMIEKLMPRLESGLAKAIGLAFKKRKKVNVEELLQYYMKLYPETKLPVVKRKAKKGKKN